MQKITLSILTLALAYSCSAEKLDRSVRPKAGSAPEIKLGKTDKFILPNGMRVFVVENHKLPTVSFDIQLDIYQALEGNMAGYRDMMSELLLSGTKTRNNDKLNQEIDYIGADIDVSDDEISGTALKKHQEKLLALMSDIAMNSDIKKEEMEKARKRALSGLEAAKNEPDQMLQNVSAVVNFGTGHPYGEVPTDATVKNITLEQCRKYYSTYFRPNVAYMAIVGDVTMAEVKPMIEKYFGSWQKADVPVAKYSDPSAPSSAKLAFVPREGAVQSVINVTYPVDLKPGVPDVIKTRVTNSILGGGSNGRLFLNLREKHGWTYGSYSSITQDELKGTFTAYAKCRNVVSDSSVGEIISEMQRLQNEKVGDEELQNHLRYLSGAFAINLESPKTVAQYAINIERYHMPADYYQNYLKNLNAVTADDIQTIARTYIHPDKANIVVVGSKGDVDKTLAKFASNGEISYYDNYGQPLKSGESAAVPAGVTADAIMKKYIAALGGEKAIMGVKEIKTVSKASIDAGGQQLQLTITEMKKAPNKLLSKVEGMGMVFQKKALNGDKGYQEVQGQKTELKPEEITEAKEEADIYADLHPAQYGITRTVKSVEKVNGEDAYMVENMHPDGKKSTEYYSVKSGYLLKQVKTEETPQGAVTIASEYSDYKEVPASGGFKVPYSVKATFGPQVIDAKVESVQVNSDLAESEFN